MNVSDLAKKDVFRCINQPKKDKKIKGCYISDLLSWVMGHAEKGDCWVTIMSHVNIIAVASLLELSCVILTEGELPDEDTIKRADENDIMLLTTEKTSYQTAKYLVELGIK
jgi:hypothetical protein